jgi:cell shape-determining protein MreC
VVSEVKPDSSKPFAVVTSEPLAQLDKSREVLLVWKEKIVELPEQAQAADKAAAEEPVKEGDGG